MSDVVTADQILAVLKWHHNDARQWLFIPELRLGTGYGDKWEQRIDAFALNCYPSHGMKSIAYEIKVSRADFLRELKQPEKRRGAMEVSNEFYFAAPPGMITKEELPADCGLVETNGDGFRIAVFAPFRDRPSAQWRFVASLARRIMASDAVQAGA